MGVEHGGYHHRTVFFCVLCPWRPVMVFNMGSNAQMKWCDIELRLVYRCNCQNANSIKHICHWGPLGISSPAWVAWVQRCGMTTVKKRPYLRVVKNCITLLEVFAMWIFQKSWMWFNPSFSLMWQCGVVPSFDHIPITYSHFEGGKSPVWVGKLPFWWWRCPWKKCLV